jgi:hypothetical protein
VRDAARQPSDRLELLRLQQRPLELLARGDVARDLGHGDDRAVGVAHR